MLSDLRHDLRQALRALRSHPAFATIAVLTLALGIGATTAIYALVNSALLRPLPFAESGRLMSIFLRMPVESGARSIDMVWSHPKYRSFVTSQRVFDDVAI